MRDHGLIQFYFRFSCSKAIKQVETWVQEWLDDLPLVKYAWDIGGVRTRISQVLGQVFLPCYHSAL